MAPRKLTKKAGQAMQELKSWAATDSKGVEDVDTKGGEEQADVQTETSQAEMTTDGTEQVPEGTRRRSRTSLVPIGKDPQGNPLQADDMTPYTPKQKKAWDRALPSLPSDMRDSWHEAVRKKDRQAQIKMVNSAVYGEVVVAVHLELSERSVASW